MMDTFFIVLPEGVQALAVKRGSLLEAVALAGNGILDGPQIILQAVARLIPERRVTVQRLTGAPRVRRSRAQAGAAEQQEDSGPALYPPEVIEAHGRALSTAVDDALALVDQWPDQPQDGGATLSPPSPTPKRRGRRPKAAPVVNGDSANAQAASGATEDVRVRAERASLCLYCREGEPFLTEDRRLHVTWNAAQTKQIEMPCEAAGEEEL